MDQSQTPDIIDLLLKIAGLVIPALLAWGLALLQKRTNIQLTQQQRDTVLHSAETAAGELINDILAGRLKPTELTRDHPEVRKVAFHALQPVCDSAQKISPPVEEKDMARIVLGKVGNKLPQVVSSVLPPQVVAPPRRADDRTY